MAKHKTQTKYFGIGFYLNKCYIIGLNPNLLTIYVIIHVASKTRILYLCVYIYIYIYIYIFVCTGVLISP